MPTQGTGFQTTTIADFQLKISGRVPVLLQDVFPKQHPSHFSEALGNSIPLRWTCFLFSFDRYATVKFECAFRHFHWSFFNCIENMFTKPSLFILLDHRTGSQYGKAIALLEQASPIINNVDIPFTKICWFLFRVVFLTTLPNIC